VRKFFAHIYSLCAVAVVLASVLVGTYWGTYGSREMFQVNTTEIVEMTPNKLVIDRTIKKSMICPVVSIDHYLMFPGGATLGLRKASIMLITKLIRW